MLKKSILIAGLILALLLAGCAQEMIPYEDSAGGVPVHKISNSYKLLNARKYAPIQGEAGRTLHLAYTATVSAGSLALELVSPDNQSLWKVSPPQTGSGQVDLQLPKTGTYTLKISASQTSGRYEVWWNYK
jgi:hypothetical protein